MTRIIALFLGSDVLIGILSHQLFTYYHLLFLIILFLLFILSLFCNFPPISISFLLFPCLSFYYYYVITIFLFFIQHLTFFFTSLAFFFPPPTLPLLILCVCNLISVFPFQFFFLSFILLLLLASFSSPFSPYISLFILFLYFSTYLNLVCGNNLTFLRAPPRGCILSKVKLIFFLFCFWFLQWFCPVVQFLSFQSNLFFPAKKNI